MRGAVFAAAFVLAAASNALAAPDAHDQPFVDGAKDSKVHSASGFVCPLKIGQFERDAAGQADQQSGADGHITTIAPAPLF